MNKTKYYHYTPEIRIPEILKSEKIMQATLYLYKNEKPCVWLSTNPIWEKTATKCASTSDGRLTQLNFEEQLELFGCARIEVNSSNLIPWTKLKHVAEIDSKLADALEDIGNQKGANPMEWYGSLSPIGINDWIKIEVYKNGSWIEILNFK
jgi:hypothetical protein